MIHNIITDSNGCKVNVDCEPPEDGLVRVETHSREGESRQVQAPYAISKLLKTAAVLLTQLPTAVFRFVNIVTSASATHIE